jgi:hypothetical protein
MPDTTPPEKNRGSNKIVLLLLGVGTVILVIALVILVKRRYEPAQPPASPQVENAMEEPVPLVIAQPTRPLAEIAEPDAGNSDAQDDKKTRPYRSQKIGSIDPKQVSEFMNARFGQVKACYERRLKMNSFLEGKLDLNIDISSVGRVNAITVNDDTIGDSQMLDCVKRAIRSWEFPKPKGGRVIVGKTFNFKKKGA